MTPGRVWPYQSLLPPPQTRNAVLLAVAAKICSRNCCNTCSIIDPNNAYRTYATLASTICLPHLRGGTGPISKTRQIRKLHLPATNTHLAEFGAAPQCRDRLVRVEQERSIECA